ncbi:hypothetical protein KFK09_008177 [Dendrobium nobile]|uniref:Integrase catalytic domain-containing protein n=1 Tax=Dendrobium nobile TaxID=94219 RepID=A0A8T3BMX3_DENNO|nr:hypothetical protein KFK09_008177 [Dendrobium nobile]
MLLHKEQVLLKAKGEEKVAIEEMWYLDSGASNHMTGDKEKFIDLNEGVYGKVKLGDGSLVKIQGKGTVLLQCKTGEHKRLSDVYYIPMLCNNIISLGQLTEQGCKAVMQGEQLFLFDKQGSKLAEVQKNSNWLYLLNLKIGRPICLSASLKIDAWLWHARFGHINFQTLKEMQRGKLVHGIPEIDHPVQICDGCTVDKQHRLPFPRETKFRAEKPLQLLHGDICGPITPATPSGFRYFLLLVDDFSRYMWVYLLKSKSEAHSVFSKFKIMVENESEMKIKALRTDRGGEFQSFEFKKLCKENGIKRFLTAPYTPQQNGVVERRNQTVMSMARCLLKSKSVPCIFWGEAKKTSVHILNRALTHNVQGMTPYEAWMKCKPNVQYFRTFGCIAYVKATVPHMKKLEDRSHPMVLFGYEPGTKAYRVYDPNEKKIHISRDIIFDEEKE